MPVYCITGTNRGLGLEWVRQLGASDENIIIATVRSLSGPDLTALKATSSARTHVLECDTGDWGSIRAFAEAAKAVLEEEEAGPGRVGGVGGVKKKIDYLINSAGINSHPDQDSLTLEAEAVLHQVQVNVLGPAQTVESLLRAGLLSADVRVFNLTSGLGSIQMALGAPGNLTRKCCGYSVSKAGLNILSVHQAGDLRAKGGLPGAVVVVVDPGWAKTDMGGVDAMIEPSVSVSGMMKLLHGLRDEDNGGFFKYNGDRLPW